MLPKPLFYSLLFLSFSATAQYKNDQVLYKTVSPDDLCATLEKNKGYLLLDVRSSGEYFDTSSHTSMNIGHLKGAININVRELGPRLSEIKNYKDKPVFVYCSHSQRSRRASQMLADSGFTNVYNINGGLTSVYYTNAREKGCLESLVETNNKYQVISAIDLCNKLSSKNNNLFVLDVRYDSAFRHISKDAQDNAYGHIKNAVNIPFDELSNKLSLIPKDKEIVVTDLDGGDASKAAFLLKEKGYDKVSFLIEGIDRLLATDRNELNCLDDWYIPAAPYHIISTKEFGRLAAANKDVLYLDVRTPDEFMNKHKDSWRNIGHLANAVNIPASEISNHISELEKYKNKDIVVYTFSGGPSCFEVANTLTKKGFTKVHVLVNGLFDVRWTAANIKGEEKLKDLVTDVPEVNW